MGYAVRNTTTGWIGGWSRFAPPPHDPEMEEIVECEIEDLEGLKPSSQVQRDSVPKAVSPLQARKALRQAGMMSTITAALSAADEETREAWEYATEIRRDNVLLSAVAAGAGMTDEQIDDLFRLAATL